MMFTASLKALSGMLADGRVSSVELTGEFLNRIHSLNPG